FTQSFAQTCHFSPNLSSVDSCLFPPLSSVNARKEPRWRFRSHSWDRPERLQFSARGEGLFGIISRSGLAHHPNGDKFHRVGEDAIETLAGAESRWVLGGGGRIVVEAA